MAPQCPGTPADPPAPGFPQQQPAGEPRATGTQSLMELGWENNARLEGQSMNNRKETQGAKRKQKEMGAAQITLQASPSCPLTLLLLCIVHADLEDGRALVAEQAHGFGGLVQPVDAATAVLGPEEKIAVVAQPKGVVQLWALIDDLWVWGGREGS